MANLVVIQPAILPDGINSDIFCDIFSPLSDFLAEIIYSMWWGRAMQIQISATEATALFGRFDVTPSPPLLPPLLRPKRFRLFAPGLSGQSKIDLSRRVPYAHLVEEV